MVSLIVRMISYMLLRGLTPSCNLRHLAGGKPIRTARFGGNAGKPSFIATGATIAAVPTPRKNLKNSLRCMLHFLH